MNADKKIRKVKLSHKDCLLDKVTIQQLKPLLTETQYRYFSLYAQGFSGVEIAKMFNVNPSVVSRGISRAKNNLSAAMAAGHVFTQATGTRRP